MKVYSEARKQSMLKKIMPPLNVLVSQLVKETADQYGSKAARIIARMKRQGLTPGESDLAFLIPNGSFHGLLIEMKSELGKPTSAQNEYIDLMNSLGYFATVCYGAQEAKRTILAYMESKRPHESLFKGVVRQTKVCPG